MFLRELRGQRNRVQEANQALLNQFIVLQGAFSNAPSFEKLFTSKVRHLYENHTKFHRERLACSDIIWPNIIKLYVQLISNLNTQ